MMSYNFENIRTKASKEIKDKYYLPEDEKINKYKNTIFILN